ncbi:MAG TPA: sugar ABC transporter ATP-binding protein [Acidimicrobiales bacterium]
MPGAPLLEMRGITKAFLGSVVLSEVDLTCAAGEVHAVVGENGAGKSTLMKVLAGAYPPDAGEVLIDGEPRSFHHPVQAQAAGVAIIYQEFNLLPERTVAENVFVGREPARFGVVDRRRMEADTARLLDELGERSFSPRSRVGDLSVAQQQVVEVVKARSLDARILVMDEPTASLADEEASALLDLVRRLRDAGMAVLYISHRMPEVFAVADRVTVLKDGRRVATLAVADTTPPQLVAKMVGRELDGYVPPRAAPAELGEVRLRVRGGGNQALDGIDLEVRAGEIVGIGGLQGAGRTELARAIFGADPFTRGTVEVDGRVVRPRSPRDGIAAGLGFLTEDRKEEGLALAQSVKDNALLGLRSQGRRRTDTGSRTATVERLAEATELRARSLDQEVRYLSGGNQQKVVLAKWLALDPGVLLFDEPTRGIDVGAKAAIHELMRDLARSGKAIVMISSELPELIGMSDRIVVLREGRIAGELPGGATEHEVIALAAGSDPVGDGPAPGDGPEADG